MSHPSEKSHASEKTVAETRLAPLRANGLIEATVRPSMGSKREFRVEFDSCGEALTFLKFARRSDDTKILSFRQTPEASHDAQVRVRTRSGVDPVAELEVSLQMTYAEDFV